MAVNTNLYRFVGVGELSSKMGLKAGYRAFLRDQKKFIKRTRTPEESEDYLLKKSAWILLQDPIEKAEMDQLIERCATPQRNSERHAELTKRKTGNACTIASFVLSVIPTILMLLNINAFSSGIVMTVLLLLPMIVMYFGVISFLSSSSLITDVLPYVLGVIIWLLMAFSSGTIFILGILIMGLFWLGERIRNSRRGDNIWTQIS